MHTQQKVIEAKKIVYFNPTLTIDLKLSASQALLLSHLTNLTLTRGRKSEGSDHKDTLPLFFCKSAATYLAYSQNTIRLNLTSLQEKGFIKLDKLASGFKLTLNFANPHYRKFCCDMRNYMEKQKQTKKTPSKKIRKHSENELYFSSVNVSLIQWYMQEHKQSSSKIHHLVLAYTLLLDAKKAARKGIEYHSEHIVTEEFDDELAVMLKTKLLADKLRVCTNTVRDLINHMFRLEMIKLKHHCTSSNTRLVTLCKEIATNFSYTLTQKVKTVFGATQYLVHDKHERQFYSENQYFDMMMQSHEQEIVNIERYYKP